MFKKSKLVRGALILAVGTFLSKILGAIYRVPLSNILGGEGVGLYQMIFPVYAVLLDFSGAGVPNALSKIIASKSDKIDSNSAEQYLASSLRFFAVLGIIGTIFTAFSAKILSKTQGDERAYLGYLLISPSVFLVSIISCFRGYFQGKMRMTPTAVSGVIEQTVKLGAGLVLISSFKGDLVKAVGGATLAITLSECVALLVLFITYKKTRRKSSLPFVFDRFSNTARVKEIVKLAVPVTLVSIIIPFSQVIDSFLIINVLGTYRQDATALFGLFSGASSTVLALPVSLCHGLAVSSIPAISSSKTQEEMNKNSAKVLLLTLLLSLPCAVGLALFSPFVVKILFSNFSIAEKNVVISLIRISAPNVVLLSFVQTANAVLIAKGKPYACVINLSVGVVVKTVLNLTLLKNPELNIYGGAISVIACYFTVCLLNLIVISNKKVTNASKIAYRRQLVG